MKYVKFFLLCIFSLALGWALSWWLFPANAQEDSLVLQTTTDNILNSEKITETHKDKAGKILNAEEVIKYDYISDKKADGEFIFQGRPYTNAKVISRANGHTTIAFYGSDQFAQTPGGVYQINTATTTIQAWEIQTKTSSFQKIKNALYRIAYADSFYSGEGDGYVLYGVIGQNWATAHDASTGTTVDYAGDQAALNTYWQNSGWKIQRSFLPFDTSAIGDSDTITGGSLYVYVEVLYHDHNETLEYSVVAESTPASPTSLLLTDYPSQGSTALSETHLISELAGNSYNSWALNTVGKNIISKTGYTLLSLRNGYDMTNTAPSANSGDSGFIWSTSEHDGTSQDAYLELTIEAGGEPPAPPEATSTPTLAPHIDYLYYLDTNGSITSLLYVPFIDLLLVFLALFLAIILCAFFYYVAVLRKK